MKKNMFKVMALSLAMATLSTTAAFAAGWGKVGSEWYYYQEDGTVARNTWINTLVSNDESGELTYQVGNKYDVAVGMRLVGYIFPFENEPEYQCRTE